MTLTKASLCETLNDDLGLNKRESKEMIEQFYEEIRVALENGEQVKLSGFGNFDLRDKAPRPGRNPKTGEEIPITARRVVTFKAGIKLKESVDNYSNAVFSK
ncbi:MAG: integration host factor subunit alpha [Gammaproteobacteria bacterium]|jgi:integration host factor subunit alpha|nr:integration host factor subunit alpha [Gammaproteobacteria bacterium]MBT7308721.1 integration host factor subunit alpha [Gammaproteobacteria bacterium]